MRKMFAVVLILVGYANGQTTKAPPVVRTPKAPTAPTEGSAQNHVGRYQIFFSPHARADVYLLDTETGRIWTPMTVNNARDDNFKTSPEVWVYQYRLDDQTDFDLWVGSHQPIPPVPTPPTTPPQTPQ